MQNNSQGNLLDMRIAILTLPFGVNYGCILQAFALQKKLEQMGYEVQHLQPMVKYPLLHPWWQMPIVFLYRVFKRFILNDRKLKIFECPLKTLRVNTDVFLYNNVNIRYLTDGQWNKLLANDYDAFIVGSDQIWRKQFSSSYKHMFLDFIKGERTKRIAYAASFGTFRSEFSEDDLNECRDLLKSFDAISVREQSGVDICQSVFSVSARHVIDPTLLLTMKDYVSIAGREKYTIGSNTLMCYILDETPEKRIFIQDCALKMKLVPVSINGKVKEQRRPMTERIQPPVEKWLKGFIESQFVITDSFHGCVFSIIFHKPFLCFGNKDRGQDRFTTLLSTFGLEDRLISPAMSSKVPPDDIDWKRVDEILNVKRTEAEEFLGKALQS